jgi:phosphatidylinositol glycan class Q protein
MKVSVDLLHRAAPFFPLLVQTIAISGIGGLAFVLVQISDVLQVLTIHIYLCYLVTTTASHQLLHILSALWNLFQGQGIN